MAPEYAHASALDVPGYLSACERNDESAATAFLQAIRTPKELYDLVSSLTGHCVGLLRMASSLTGKSSHELIAEIARESEAS